MKERSTTCWFALFEDVEINVVFPLSGGCECDHSDLLSPVYIFEQMGGSSH